MDIHSLYQKIGQRDPGSVVFTSYYLTPLPLDRRSVVADIGSGYGDRATWVSRSRCCEMHLFDHDTRCLDLANERAEEGGSSQFIKLNHVASGDYFNLNTSPQQYDLVITEGLGFSMNTLQGINTWRTLVKPGGALVITMPGIVNRHTSPDTASFINERRGGQLGTLEDYHEQLAEFSGVRLVHQVTLPQYTWDEHYQNVGRCLKGLIRSGVIGRDDEISQIVQGEIDWYRSSGRGQVFLQAFVLGID